MKGEVKSKIGERSRERRDRRECGERTGGNFWVYRYGDSIPALYWFRIVSANVGSVESV